MNKTALAGLVRSEFDTIADNEEFIEEFLDEEIATSTSDNYLESLAGIESRPRASVEKIEDENLLTTTQKELALSPEIGVMTPEESKSGEKTTGRQGAITYIVKAGDSISTIAQKYNINANTILWENNLSSHSIIRPGDKLSILPQDGITHEVKRGESITYLASKYRIEKEDILKANKISDANSLKIGQKLIIPGATRSAYASSNQQTYSGISIIKDLVKSPSAKPAAGNKMNWPTNSSRITQYYSWRHYGLDIGNKTGQPIYSADAGSVEVAGRASGYGNYVIINHGGGKKTLYAHCSKIYVVRGQKVGKGETIAAIGSTGWSTGPHLHFEVRINGVKYNPLNYIK